MITAKEIIAWARAQIGVKENPPSSNNVKYNTAYYGREVSGNYPWCCAFVWDAFEECGGSDLFYGGGKTASCTALMNYAKKNGLWVTKNFKPGDLILFNFDKVADADHIGICVGTTAKTVICIEGNTSLTSNDNGGAVMQRTRDLSVVLGAYRPKYAAASEDCEKVKANVPVLRQNVKGYHVGVMQTLLNAGGFDCGEVDGCFGPKTLAGVKSYQGANGLVADGIAGPATWAKLLG